MKRILSTAILSLFLMLICFTQPGYCAEDRPEQFIKNFYTWYITVNEGRARAIKNADIYKYVAKETVEKVREISAPYGSDRRDYFLKTFDSPLSMDGVSIEVGEISNMGMGTFVVPVTITTTFPDGYHTLDRVVVVVKKIDGALKITKCVDIYPEA